MDDTCSGNALDEWKESRAILARFDENLHDIRKYGFTFLAGLLTIDILQILVTNPDSNIGIGLISITIVLILTLWLFDLHYQKIQQATSIRANILETALNFELTETISYKFDREKLHEIILALYIFFIFIAFLIGCIVVQEGPFRLLLYAITVFGTIYIVILPRLLEINNLHPIDLYFNVSHIKSQNGKVIFFTENWKISPVACRIGDIVNIMYQVKNGEGKIKPITIEIWKEDKQGEEKNNLSNIIQGQLEKDICTFSWNTKGCEPNTVYRIWPSDHIFPLSKSIIVFPEKANDFLFEIWISLMILISTIITVLSYHITSNLFFLTNAGLDIPKEDWIIDKCSCNGDDIVKITCTNLDNNKSLEFKKGEPSFKIQIHGDYGDDRYTWFPDIKDKIIIPAKGNHTWLWSAEKSFEDRIYQICPRGWNQPLKRMIFVCKTKNPSSIHNNWDPLI